MNVLDENFPKDQRLILQGWRISVHHIGFDLGWDGMKDAEIFPLLHQLRRPTFFTFDLDFFRRRLCHAGYSLVYLVVPQTEAAAYVRRLLRHPDFNTQAKRMGSVIRVARPGLTVWRLHAESEESIPWYR
jgi:hypothetical protein